MKWKKAVVASNRFHVPRKDVIDKAHHWRQVIGGGMCQAGCFAAVNLVALDTMVERLAQGHRNAKQFASATANLGLAVDLDASRRILSFVELPEHAGDSVNFVDRTLVRVFWSINR